MQLPSESPASRSPLRRVSTQLAAALLAFCACDPYVEGSGVYGEEDRTGSVDTPFTGIHVEDGVVGTVTSQAASYKVVVSGDSNVLRYIRTQVEDDATLGIRVLHVWVESGYSSTNPSAVVVQTPELVYAFAKQNARLDVIDAATTVFTANAASGANISIAGPHDTDPAGDPAGDAIHVSASNGTVDASHYVTTGSTEAAAVDLAANALVRLHADGPVVGTVSGGSRLYNAGTDTCTAVLISGAATVDCPGIP